MQEIQNTNAPNPEWKIGRLISLISRGERNYFSKRLARHSITSNEMSILLGLHYFGHMNQDSLSRMLHINKVSMSRLCARLIRESFMHKTPSTQDKRSHQLSLAEKSQLIMPDLIQATEDWQSILSADVSTGDMDNTKKILCQVIANISHATQGPTSG